MTKACAPKGRLPYKQRKKLPAHAFAMPSVRMFPLYKLSEGKLLPSRKHAINAKARAQQAFNRGELSKSTLAKIDRQADRVIKECEKMAKAKKKTSKKKSSAKRKLTAKQKAALAKGRKAMAAKRKKTSKKKATKKKATKKKAVRKVKISRGGREVKQGRIPRVKADLMKADMTMLRSIDRQAKRGKPVHLKQYSSTSSKNRIRTLEKGGFVAALPGVGKGYALTPKGASAIGNVYKSLAKIEKAADTKVSKPARKRKKAAAKKKTAKKRAKKKTTAVAKRKTSAVAKPKKKRAKKSRTVHARYKKGIKVKVYGSKKRVPVEVRDVPSVKNKVIVLV